MAELKVENAEQLTELLNGLLPAIRSKVVIDGLIAGANLVNCAASRSLNANRKGTGKSGGSYYASIFRYEQLKGKNPDELGIRTGVWDRKNGYKLRWLEWGTDDRKTFKRINRVTKKTTQPADRGRIEGNGYFFNAVRDNQSRMFEVVSDAIIKSLEELTRGKN